MLPVTVAMATTNSIRCGTQLAHSTKDGYLQVF